MVTSPGEEALTEAAASRGRLGEHRDREHTGPIHVGSDVVVHIDDQWD